MTGDDVTIEKATAADLDEVARLYGAVCDALEGGTNYSDWARGRYPTRQTAQDWLAEGALYVLRDSEGIGATVALPHWQPEEYGRARWQVEAEDGEMLVVHTVATHPGRRRRGYSRRLMAFAVEEARRQGKKALRLDVSEFNTPAIPIYESAGFRCVDRYDLFGKPAPHDRYRLYEYDLEAAGETVLLREMVPGDYDRAVTLWKGTEGMGLHAVEDSRAEIEGFLARNPGLCFVAEERGALVGTILCGNDGRRGHIYHLAVAGDRRRRGIGRRLVDRGLAAMEAAGIRKMTLVVFGDNEDGNRFWESAGFSSRGDLVYRDRKIGGV